METDVTHHSLFANFTRLIDTSPRFKLRNPDKNLCLSHLQTVERSSSIYYSECDQNPNNDNLWIFYEPVAESEDVYYLASSKNDVNECIGTCKDMQQLQLVSGCENNHERYVLSHKIYFSISTYFYMKTLIEC